MEEVLIETELYNGNADNENIPDMLMPIFDVPVCKEKDIFCNRKLLVYTTRLERMKVFNKTWEGSNLKKLTSDIIKESKPTYNGQFRKKMKKIKRKKSYFRLQCKIQRFNEIAYSLGKYKYHPTLRVYLENMETNITSEYRTLEQSINERNKNKNNCTRDSFVPIIIKKETETLSISTDDEDDADDVVLMNLKSGKSVMNDNNSRRNDFETIINTHETKKSMPLIEYYKLSKHMVILLSSKTNEACSYVTDDYGHLLSYYKDNLNRIPFNSIQMKHLIFRYCCYFNRKSLISRLDFSPNCSAFKFLKMSHECEPRMCVCCHSNKSVDCNSNNYPTYNKLKYPAQVRNELYEKVTQFTQKNNSQNVKCVNNKIQAKRKAVKTNTLMSVVILNECIMLEQTNIVAEAFIITNKGDVQNHMILNSLDNINSLTKVNSTRVCCWYAKESFLNKLKNNKALKTSALEFMKSPHLCIKSKNCVCCCKPLNQNYSRVVRNAKPSPTNKHSLDTSTKISFNEIFKLKKSEFSSSLKNKNNKFYVKLQNFIKSMLTKVQQFRFTVNEQGKLLATFNSVEKSLPDEGLKAVQDMLAVASTYIAEIGITTQQFCSTANANIQKVETFTSYSKLMSRKCEAFSISYYLLFAEQSTRKITFANKAALIAANVAADTPVCKATDSLDNISIVNTFSLQNKSDTQVPGPSGIIKQPPKRKLKAKEPKQPRKKKQNKATASAILTTPNNNNDCAEVKVKEDVDTSTETQVPPPSIPHFNICDIQRNPDNPLLFKVFPLNLNNPSPNNSSSTPDMPPPLVPLTQNTSDIVLNEPVVNVLERTIVMDDDEEESIIGL